MVNYMKYGLGVLLSLSMVSDASAIGAAFIGNEVPSARAAGAGYVGVAGQNNDPTAVYTNPGAMTALKGTQLTAGLTFENIRGGYETDAGAKTKANMTNVAIPNFSMTQSFMDGKLSAGLGSQSPFGLETHWDDNSPMRYVATNSRLGMVQIMPAVAYQVHPKVSVGVGADYVNLFTAQLDRQVYTDGVNTDLHDNVDPAFAQTSGAADTTSSLQGQAADWGYHLGMVFMPTEQHALGLTYHSQVNLHVKGNITLRNMTGGMATLFGGTDFTTSAYTDVVLPSNVQLGYAYKPNEKWSLEADAAYYHWSNGRDFNVRTPAIDPTTATGAVQTAVLTNRGNGNPVPLNPRDAWSLAFGANYKVNDRWQARSGMWYEPHALPESTFNPAFLDLSRYGLSAGAGYGITENLSLDMAYTAVFMHNRTIHNNVQSNASGIPDGTPLPSGVASSNGTYSDFANLLSLNVTYRFFGAGK